jgi:hypothetical protein
MDEELLSGGQIEDGNTNNSVEPLLHVDNGNLQAIPQHLLLVAQGRGRGVRRHGRKQ